MRLLLASLVCATALVCQPGVGASFLAKGIGAHPCSYMLENFTFSDREHWRSWITGFISGLNRNNGRDVGRGVDEMAMVYEVKNYCERNPIDGVALAVIWVYNNRLK